LAADLFVSSNFYERFGELRERHFSFFLSFFFFFKDRISAGCWWLIPVILATQEAEIRGIKVRS
jgi:hypothetical protein